jgi:hypothetical protein
MKSGYLYVLVHPSDPNLYKIGVTTQHPEKRLAAHNSNYKEYAGQVVKKTGQKWKIKTYIAVPDPYWAESVFWSATTYSVIPYRRGIEIERMEWKEVQPGLEAAKKAGLRPPDPVPDWVYVYTARIKKRLEGRNIKLVGQVRSMTGKSTFQCSNGHEWRTVPDLVGNGAGCPQCGIGEKDSEEIRQSIKPGHLYLLINPNKPGFIKIKLTDNTPEEGFEEINQEGWQVHRYRSVEETGLAESIIWELLGTPKPNGHEPIKMELNKAEQAFRDLIYRMHNEIALMEKKKEEKN